MLSADAIRQISFRWHRRFQPRTTTSSLTEFHRYLCRKHSAHENTERALTKVFNRYSDILIASKSFTGFDIKEDPARQVDREIKSTTSPYSSIEQGCFCESCGKYIGTTVNSKLINIIYLNEWLICRDKRCRAIAAAFNRGRKRLPLINVINEVTKHGNKKRDNPHKRRLEKHFIRYAGCIPK